MVGSFYSIPLYFSIPCYFSREHFSIKHEFMTNMIFFIFDFCVQKKANFEIQDKEVKNWKKILAANIEPLIISIFLYRSP